MDKLQFLVLILVGTCLSVMRVNIAELLYLKCEVARIAKPV